MLSPLRTQRYDFATFAVNGFVLFQQPQTMQYYFEFRRNGMYINIQLSYIDNL